jgi:hypothetical protein
MQGVKIRASTRGYLSGVADTEPAAVLEALLVRPSRSTFEAARAARALVLRPDIFITSFHAIGN